MLLIITDIYLLILKWTLRLTSLYIILPFCFNLFYYFYLFYHQSIGQCLCFVNLLLCFHVIWKKYNKFTHRSFRTQNFYSLFFFFNVIRLRNKSAQIIKCAELNHVTWDPLPDFLSGKSRKQMFGEIVCLLLFHSQQFDLWPNTGANKLCCTEAETLWNFESLEIKTLLCKSFLINTSLESLRFKKMYLLLSVQLQMWDMDDWLRAGVSAYMAWIVSHILRP